MSRKPPSIEVRKLAREIAEIKRLVKNRTPQLGHSSIEDGTIAEYDDTGQLVQVIGTQFDGTHTAASVAGPNPPQPSRGTSLGIPGGFTVEWDGLFENPDDVAPMDWLRLDVVEDTDPGFDPLVKPPTTSIASPRGGKVFIPTADQATRYVYLIARSQSGKASDPSYGQAVDPIASGVSDGDAPADAPATVTAQPFAIRAGWVAWAKPDNADPLTYRVYISDTSGVDDTDELAAETDSLYAVVDHFGGDVLDPAKTYYAVVYAGDDDGWGPASSEVSFQPRQAANDDISAEYVYAGTVQARQILSDVMGAELAVAGRIYIADIDPDTGQPIEGTTKWVVDGDTGAMRAYRKSDGKEMLTVDPATDSFVWRGDGEFDHATFINGTIQGGGNEIAEGGTLVLQKGVTTPKNGPSVSLGWDEIQLSGAGSENSGLTPDGSGGYYTTSLGGFFGQTIIISHYDSSGAFVDQITGGTANELGGIYRVDSTHIYVLGRAPGFGTNAWDVHLFTESGGWQSSSRWPGFGPDVSSFRRPTIGYDSSTSKIIIAASVNSTADPSIDDTVVFCGYTFVSGGTMTEEAGGPLSVGLDCDSDLAFASRESFDLGSRHHHYMRAGAGGLTRAVNLLGGSELPDFEFHTGGVIVGMCYDGTNFRSLTADGRVRKYESGSGNRWSTSTDDNWYVAYTWYQATGGYETLRSPYTSVTMKKRAKLIVQTAPIPGGSSNPPSEARVYLKKGTTSPGTNAAIVNMRRQATSATGDPPTVEVVNADFGTSNNPAAANFPTTGSPATIESSDLSVMMSANDTDQAWTPVVTAVTTNPTGYTATGRYRIESDGWVDVQCEVTFGAGLPSGQVSVSLPVTLLTRHASFTAWMWDASADANYEVRAVVDDVAKNKVAMYRQPGTAGNGVLPLNGTNPITIASGDKFGFNFRARKA